MIPLHCLLLPVSPSSLTSMCWPFNILVRKFVCSVCHTRHCTGLLLLQVNHLQVFCDIFSPKTQTQDVFSW